MANYIKNEVLCEAYSRLNVHIADDSEALEKLRVGMLSFFNERAQFLFGDDVKVEIEFEEGSLITKVKVIGSAAAVILLALNAYGSFRQSMDYLVKDSTLLAQSANLEMVFRTKAAFCDRVRVEKRRGIFGRVDELLSELDGIKREISLSTLPSSQRAISGFTRATTEKLVAWEKKAQKVYSKLDHDDTRACIAAGLLEELESVPTAAPWAKELDSQTFRATIAKSDPEQAGLVAAAATRYQATVTSLKKSYEDLVKQYAPKAT